MNEFIKKATKFGKEHKKALIITGIGTGLIVAFVTGEKYALDRAQTGFDIIDRAGLIDWKILRDDGNFDIVSQKEFCSWIAENRDVIRELGEAK